MTRTDPSETTTSPIVIVPCSKGKALVSGRVEAQDLYVGPYHVAAMRAARNITTPDRIFILSAMHGLLRLTDLVASYDMKLGDEGCVTEADVRQQAVEDLGLDLDAEVVILAGGIYKQILLAVFRNGICPFVKGARPVPGLRAEAATCPVVRGIGDHKAWFKRKRRPLAGAQGRGRRRARRTGARLLAV